MNYKELHFSDVKITEVEDPFSYEIEGLFEQRVFNSGACEIEIRPKCKRHSLLIMDNEKHNETYLKDLFDEFEKNLKEDDKEKFENTDFYYTGDVKLRMMILKPHICNIKRDYSEQEKSTLEHQVLVPTILSFNPNGMIGFIEEPRMGVIVNTDIADIFKFLHDDSIKGE